MIRNVFCAQTGRHLRDLIEFKIHYFTRFPTKWHVSEIETLKNLFIWDFPGVFF